MTYAKSTKKDRCVFASTVDIIGPVSMNAIIEAQLADDDIPTVVLQVKEDMLDLGQYA